MEKKKSIKRKALVVPKDRAEMEQFVSRIREREEKINSIGTEATKEIAKWAARINSIKKNASAQAKPFEDEINELAKGVFIFASGHQAELTDEGRKRTVEFSTGDKIRWYFTPPSVVVEDEEKAIAELERRDLGEFIRKKKRSTEKRFLKPFVRRRRRSKISNASRSAR